jgi:chemosensory pili system protein ChpA (sensor histidine kinase/response regulator)
VERTHQAPLVLVAEDDAETLGWLRIVLREELGFRVALATDGRQALERARRHRPAVAVIDVEMPELDGYEVARRMRADSRLADCWLIALTAFGKPSTAARAGFDRFIAKPTDLDTLLDAVREGAEHGLARAAAGTLNVSRVG